MDIIKLITVTLQLIFFVYVCVFSCVEGCFLFSLFPFKKKKKRRLRRFHDESSQHNEPVLLLYIPFQMSTNYILLS